jgi:hypothetical protein
MCSRPDCNIEYGYECECSYNEEKQKQEQESWIVFNSIGGSEIILPEYYLAIQYAQSKCPNSKIISNAYHTVFTVGNYYIYMDN